MLYWYKGGESIGDDDDNSGGGDGSNDVYKGSAEPVLVPLSELYFKDDRFFSS